MCENFNRLDALIVKNNIKYIPDNWSGKNDVVVQEELLEHILAYILKLAFDKLMSESGEKSVSESEWYVIAKIFWMIYVFFISLIIYSGIWGLTVMKNVREYKESISCM